MKCTQLDIDEMEDCSFDQEYADVDVKKILRRVSREGRNIFEVFKVKEEGEHLCARKRKESARGKSLEGKPKTGRGRQAKAVCRL